MALPFSEDLLSAYLDGETNPEETALVERLLAEQPELQSELHQLTDLSQSIQALPRIPAPDDFVQSVLSEVNQRRPVQPKSPSSMPEEKSRSSRLWKNGLIAASLLVAVGLFSLRLREAKMPLEMAANSEIGDRLEADSVAFTNAPAGEAESALKDAGALTSESSIALKESPPFPLASMELNSETIPADDLTIAAVPRVVTLDKETIANRLSSLSDTPKSGDEVSVVAMNGDSPILVDFTVIDAQKTLGQLQVLLKNHSVQAVSVGQDFESKLDSDQKLVAIYLDLDEPVFEEILSQVSAIEAVVFVSEEAEQAAGLGQSGEAKSRKQQYSLTRRDFAQPMAARGVKTSPADGHQLRTLDRSKLKSSQENESTSRVKTISTEQQFRFDMSSVRETSKASMYSDSAKPAPDSAEPFLEENSLSGPKPTPPPPSLPIRATGGMRREQSADLKNAPSPRRNVLEGTEPAATKPMSKASAQSRSSDAPGASAKEQENAPERIRALLLLREEQE
ncbi:anti-sigma factor family protein [Thalassoglobus polymorphus]|uniref:Zinc-finger domain-containing protein n=1 Tax=Thalassoglobus polymorphus TaxID=2527994 RepID=A0A517QQA1_9PLAN|nr:hypothetical protein [Thalassoglobus polymorphus]QDT33794.1 hypothetical protein Mal48_30490 [Thalassoglobus polymorphus]